MVVSAVLTSLGVADRLRQQRHALSEAERRAKTDPLTGVSNRRSLLEQLDAECRNARANNLPVAVLFLDLDFFKAINDSYGHAAGDACLAAVIGHPGGAATVGHHRPLWRRGILVVLSGADASAAEPIAERIRLRVSEVDIEGNGAPIRLTCSIGVASSDPLGVWGEALIAKADAAVYAANASAAIACRSRFLSRRSTAAQHCCRLPPVGAETRCASRRRQLVHALLPLSSTSTAEKTEKWGPVSVEVGRGARQALPGAVHCVDFILLAASAACAAAPIHLASISRYHHRHHYRHHRGTAQQPGLRSTEALVVDVTDHKVLYARKADVRVPIASISKLMTSLVVAEAGQPLDEELQVDPRRPGYRSRRVLAACGRHHAQPRELFHLALMASENRAAHALRGTIRAAWRPASAP